MNQAVSVFLSLFFLSGVAVCAAWVLSCGLTLDSRRPQLQDWFLRWSARGLLAPLVIWALMNVGFSWWLQPFMPQVQVAQNRGIGWFPAYLQALAVGLFVISTYWTAMTLGWVLVEAGASTEGEARARFKGLCLTWFLATVVPGLLLVWLGGWSLLGMAGILLLAPIASYCPDCLNVRKTPPMYARAIARIKFGKYSEAEWEIIRELERCEDDFDGWMMLAGLYANNFNDPIEAEQTILGICDHPKTTPSQLSVALHQLAEWQLQRGDPAAARRSLQMICTRLPGTHLAHMAQLRINQLPASTAGLRQQQSASVIPLPALGDSFDEAPAQAAPGMERYKAAEEANACVEILEADPKNVPARERLARLFAERLDQPDLGIEQATLLLEIPGQPDSRRAEWLGLIAAWQIRYRHDSDAGRKTLERLVREFPQSTQAFSARRRLRTLDGKPKF